MSNYKKSDVKMSILGSKGSGGLDHMQYLGWKGARSTQILGQKAKNFWDRYGEHLPHLGEHMKIAEPYLDKVDVLEKKLRKPDYIQRLKRK